MTAIPLSYLDAVVSIAYSVKNPWQSNATGFLYGKSTAESSASRNYDVYLVTNCHCFEVEDLVYPEVFLSINPKERSKPAAILTLETIQNNTRLWTSVPDIDLAVIRIAYDELLASGVNASFFASDKTSFYVDQMINTGFGEGESICVIGFEHGIPERLRSHPIVRQGSIARIQDMFEDPDNPWYMVEATIFPGGSGSPVLLNPEKKNNKNKTEDPPQIIGVISGFWPYSREIVNHAGQQQQVFFSSENRGLACVWPMDLVDRLIDLHIQRFGAL